MISGDLTFGLVVSVNLIINTKYETVLNLILIVFFDIFAFIIFMIIAHRFFIFYSIGTITSAFGSSRFWMELIFVSGTCGLIDFFIYSHLIMRICASPQDTEKHYARHKD